jgi:predicted SnoaL-like aldol condensation-catalyzing enzyme
MKKLLYTAATAMLCFFISCKDSSTTGISSTDNSQNDKNLANNRKIFKAIVTGDAATIESLSSSDGVDHQGPNGDVKGRDSITHMLADFHNHIKDLKVDVISDAANGDYVFALVHLTGTATDEMMGGAGTKLDEKGVDVVRFKDGKIAEHWGFVIKEK